MTMLKQIDFEVPGFRELASPPVTVPSYPDAVMAMTPLAYWRLGEASGSTLADEIGSHPMTLTGDHALEQDGAIVNDDNQAIYFSGGEATASNPILPTATNAPFSIAFWVRLPTGPVSGGSIIGQYDGFGTGQTRLHVRSTSILRLSVINELDFFSNTAIDTSWRFVVLSRASSGMLRWYLDGQLDAEHSGTNTTIAPVNFYIGHKFNSMPPFFLDELAIFNDELTQAQIRWLDGLGRARLALPDHL
jgi:hypothetical protein